MEGKAEGEVHLSDAQVTGECTIYCTNKYICETAYGGGGPAIYLREHVSPWNTRYNVLLLLLHSLKQPPTPRTINTVVPGTYQVPGTRYAVVSCCIALHVY